MSEDTKPNLNAARTVLWTQVQRVALLTGYPCVLPESWRARHPDELEALTVRRLVATVCSGEGETWFGVPGQPRRPVFLGEHSAFHPEPWRVVFMRRGQEAPVVAFRAKTVQALTTQVDGFEAGGLLLEALTRPGVRT